MGTSADINRIVLPPAADTRLQPAVAPDSIPAKTGFEPRAGTPVRGRELTVRSTDGLFTFRVRVLDT